MLSKLQILFTFSALPSLSFMFIYFHRFEAHTITCIMHAIIPNNMNNQQVSPSIQYMSDTKLNPLQEYSEQFAFLRMDFCTKHQIYQLPLGVICQSDEIIKKYHYY